MEVHPTPEQQAFIRRAIESGRLQEEEDGVRETLSLWEERERARAEILAALDDAEADLAGRRYSDYTDTTLPALADETRREARSPREQRG